MELRAAPGSHMFQGGLAPPCMASLHPPSPLTTILTVNREIHILKKTNDGPSFIHSACGDRRVTSSVSKDTGIPSPSAPLSPGRLSPGRLSLPQLSVKSPHLAQVRPQAPPTPQRATLVANAPIVNATLRFTVGVAAVTVGP